MVKSWEESYGILNKANKKLAKNNKEVQEILKKQNLSKDDHKKIKKLLEEETKIRNKALDKVEKIHREQTQNFEQEWTNS